MMGWLISRGKGHTQPWLKYEFAKRGPWVTRFVIDGKPYGGGLSFEDDIRIPQFFDNFPDVHSILDLGSLEGGQTFQLAKHPGVHIFGIEGRQSNIERAQFAQQVLGIKNVNFLLADLESVELTRFGQFDAVFCSGILYHLPEPWKLVKKIRAVTTKLFVWTHYATEDKADQMVNGFRGWWYGEHGLKDQLSGLSPRSFWPTLESLQAMLKQCGFTTLKILEDNSVHPHGPSVTIAAWADNEEPVSQPELYIGYSRDDKFRKISPAGATLPRVAVLLTQIGLWLPPSLRKVLRPVYHLFFKD